MYSNYPPGVTGHELEIAGPDWEGEIERACSTRNIEMDMFTDEDVALIRRVALATGGQGRGKRRDADVMQHSLRGALSRMITVTLDTCPFEGEVAAWRYERVLHWMCPLCGAEYSEDENGE